MAHAAGRNLPFAIFVTLCCAAVVVGLFILAEPIWMPVGSWLESIVPGAQRLLQFGFDS